MRIVRAVYRKADGLCCIAPGDRSPGFPPRRYPDAELVVRYGVGRFGGTAEDYVVVPMEARPWEPPWEKKWTVDGLVPATEYNERVKTWKDSRPDSPAMKRVRRRRLEQDIRLAEAEDDEEAADILRRSLRD